MSVIYLLLISKALYLTALSSELGNLGALKKRHVGGDEVPIFLIPKVELASIRPPKPDLLNPKP